MAIKIIYNVAILFAMMLPGVILKLCKLTPDGFGKGISNLVLYVAQPCLIFRAYLKEFDKEILINSLVVLLLSIIAHLVFLLALLFYKKSFDDRRRMLRFATIFSNAAFMGIPLIEVVLGAEYTIYASIYNITFNMFLWTLGVHICTDKNEMPDGRILESQASVKRAIFHPVTIAAALGIIFFVIPVSNKVEAIPEIVKECLNMISSLVAPLSMLVLGLRIPDIKLRAVIRDINLYLFILLRHLALPLVVFGIMALLHFTVLPIAEKLFMVVLILAAAPAASSATMFAEKYECDAAFVSSLVVVSTILSILTMPLMVVPVGFIY